MVISTNPIPSECGPWCLKDSFIPFEAAISRGLKHTTTLFSLTEHYILSQEWRVIVDQGRPMML